MEIKEFKSPMGKLVKFFQASRDGWKRKHQEAKRKIKRMSNQVRAVERSREHWKEKAKRERQRAQRLERELDALKSVCW